MYTPEENISPSSQKILPGCEQAVFAAISQLEGKEFSRVFGAFWTYVLHKFLDEPTYSSTLFAEIYAQQGIGQGNYHKFDVIEHTRLVITHFQSLRKQYAHYLESYLTTEIDGLPKQLLIEFALVFHDAGKKSMIEKTGRMSGHADYTCANQLSSIGERFGLRTSHYTYIETLIKYHDYPLELQENREIREKLQDAGAYPEELLITLADLMSCQGPGIEAQRITSRENFLMTEFARIFQKS